MSINRSAFVAVLISTLLPVNLYADLRTFTDDQGRQIQAELVGLSGDNVVLKRNGRMAQWPTQKLSSADQAYVRAWANSSSRTTPKIQPRIWQRDGIGSQGILNENRMTPKLGQNIPMLKQTEQKGSYKHYDVDLHNSSPVDADDLIVSYVLYVINPQNQVIGENGTQSISDIPANSRKTVSTEAVTYVRTKTTSATFSTNILGNLQVGSSTNRSKEKFAGAWVRVYSPSGKLVGEAKQLSDELEKLNPNWTGSTGENALPVPDSFSHLEELFGPLKKIIEKLPPRPGNLPRPPGLPGPLR